MAGPFPHIRVLDLSRILAAPLAAQILGDLGAEVIKIEKPGHGDDTRTFGPPWMKDAQGVDTSESAYFLAGNRNKKSITLDIATPRGQEILRELVRVSDVLIENYKVGNLDRYGLGYEDLKKINPRLIYCSLTGFGQDGPYAERPGYDFVFQGMGGLMSITGEMDGLPGGGPQKVGIPIIDYMTGLNAAIALCAALAHRERTGEGQHIDCALLDMAVAVNVTQVLSQFCGGQIPRRLGNAHPHIVPYEVFPTADGHMILAVANDAQFQRFCAVADRPSLAADPRFATNSQRVINRGILTPIVTELLAKQSRRWWQEHLEQAGVACGPINNLHEVFEDPQVLHRGLRVDMPHPLGTAPTLASPLRLSATPVSYRRAPPLLGEHTREVLEELLHMPASAVDALSAERVI
ncbi:CaiB/BaiF CoA transferase family protein [Pseudorhodoferax soli]|uniref:Crotonobetainyl-CoA:carnitine CoA-transferase CaiB-like acyl-CoA transferase n=1 Tax=Pseudorhodoferax soli TaxID=545864 RepID=A0A368XLQ0_9BURK|nr:CaiB/BaiF CoA-transferase family protein [Pseudorhodoferax soli]RCW68489.1 crotonobetainyl-CoA:carnitine CoA-transferase CaiB-like acyl-CoA transferase [Pseudorhodoferax soli]